MPRGRKKASSDDTKPIEQYEHMGNTRLENP